MKRHQEIINIICVHLPWLRRGTWRRSSQRTSRARGWACRDSWRTAAASDAPCPYTRQIVCFKWKLEKRKNRVNVVVASTKHQVYNIT